MARTATASNFPTVLKLSPSLVRIRFAALISTLKQVFFAKFENPYIILYPVVVFARSL